MAKIKVLVALDKSAAFDVIDQFILLNRLQCSFRISGTDSRQIAGESRQKLHVLIA